MAGITIFYGSLRNPHIVQKEKGDDDAEPKLFYRGNTYMQFFFLDRNNSKIDESVFELK